MWVTVIDVPVARVVLANIFLAIFTGLIANAKAVATSLLS